MMIEEEVHKDLVCDKMEKNNLHLQLDPTFTDILYLEVNYTNHNICLIYKHLYEYSWGYALKV